MSTTLKEIGCYCLIPYEKRSLTGSLANGKLAGINVFNSKGTIV